MPPLTPTCPKCGSLLNVPQPAPEKITCAKCGVGIKLTRPAKSSDTTPSGPPSNAAQPAGSPQVRVVATVKAVSGATGVATMVAGYELQRESRRRARSRVARLSPASEALPGDQTAATALISTTKSYWPAFYARPRRWVPLKASTSSVSTTPAPIPTAPIWSWNTSTVSR